jgi:FixJ family two-component response regulator
MTMNSPAIPDDFPRPPAHGAVGGAQPKVLLRRGADRLISGPTDEELFARYDASEDLVQQLASYGRRKRAENQSRSLFDLLSRMETDVTRKVSSGQWDISSAEITWIMKRVRELLTEKPQVDGTVMPDV